MRISIGIVAYALDITELVRSLAWPDVTWHCFLHSQNTMVLENCLALAHDDTLHFNLYPYGVNRGLARSWNDSLVLGLHNHADVLMIANDDISACREDMFKIAYAALDKRDCGIIEGTGFDRKMNRRQSMAWALCAVNPIALDKVGYLDENYTPIYGEDVDYACRCRKLDVKFYNAGETSIVHKARETVGSVPALAQQNQITFPRNEAYHRLKHGGGYGEEQYDHPFNNPAYSWRIAEMDRNDPYPDYRRNDLEVVRI